MLHECICFAELRERIKHKLGYALLDCGSTNGIQDMNEDSSLDHWNELIPAFESHQLSSKRARDDASSERTVKLDQSEDCWCFEHVVSHMVVTLAVMLLRCRSLCVRISATND